MAKLYKTFLSPSIVLIALICLLSMNAASANDPIFTIENIEVDVTAENAIVARQKAFEEAQIKAFETLAARMLPEGELATLQTPEPLTISTLVQDFELVNEKLSAVRYVGAYTFRFQDTAVRNFFAQKETIISDVSSRPMLVLPYLQAPASNATIWSPYNDWFTAWKRAPKASTAVPLRLPIGDLSDIRDIEDDKALHYNSENLTEMLSRYTASEAVIAIAHPDEQLSAIENPSQIAAGNLKVEIYRTDRGRPELVQQINAPANGVQTKGQLYDSAVLRVKAALKEDWKSRTLVQAAGPQIRISVTIPITGLPDWMAMQSTLKRVQGIEDITVRSLTTNEVTADLIFSGDQQRVMLALQQNGLSLEAQQFPDGRTVNILKQANASGRYQPVVY